MPTLRVFDQDRPVAEQPFVCVGDRRIVLGREFEAIRVAPHTCRDGTESQLVKWRGWCRICGVPYESGWVSRAANSLALNCFEHNRARAPKPKIVRPRRKRGRR